MAIVTYYKGYCFRSRLEAKWAAYFDLLNLPWLYEPKDLDGYIPDFIIDDLLIEVKGCGTISQLGEYIDKITQSGWSGLWTIVGDSPQIQLGKPIEINEGLWAAACNRSQWKGGWKQSQVATPMLIGLPDVKSSPAPKQSQVASPTSIGLPDIKSSPAPTNRVINTPTPQLPEL
jgi:hypothetical protein